jgi:hypothetical protein
LNIFLPLYTNAAEAVLVAGISRSNIMKRGVYS